MKRVLSVLFLSLMLCTACNAQRLPTRVVPAPSATDWDDWSVYRQGLIAAERPVLDRLPGATIYHIELDIPRKLDRLPGSEQVRYTNREEGALSEIWFRLFPNVAGGEVEIASVEVDGQRVQPTYASLDSAMRVPLPAPLSPGEQTVVQIDFVLTIPREMGGNYGLYGYFDDVLVLDTFYPMVAVYDDEGWNIETPSANGDLTYLDASMYLVRVSAPRDLTIVASGIEVGREYDGNTQIVTLAAGPARDFYIAASDRYVVVSDTVGATTVHSYAVSKYEERAEEVLQYVVHALKHYGTRFGPYPYTEMDVLSTPMQALGIEYPGATGISLALYDPDRDFGGVPSRIYLEATVAHEMGHQWFYNVVGNDQADEPWVDEALVQYVTGLYYLDVYGEEAAAQYRSSWQERWDGVERAEIPIGLPARGYEGAEYGAIVYGRGPIFMRALASEMGEGSFDAFLRDYYRTHKWGIATGETFRQLAEEHCECDLGALFAEWVYGE